VQWSLTGHEVEDVRLPKYGETIAKSDGSHTPAIDYQINDRSATLTLEAEIQVRLKKTTPTDVVNGTMLMLSTVRRRETSRTQLTLRSMT
jgi:phage baseplate assembly protein W